MKTSSGLILGYWQIRGLGQVPRLLLAYSGTEWQDHKYFEHERDRWFLKDKKQLKLEFPNLPYLIDGDFKLTESKAIAWYITQKFGLKQLTGKNLKDEARILQIIGVLDNMSEIFLICWEEDWEKQLPFLAEKYKMRSKYLNSFYGEKEFAMGYLSLADFYVVELSYYIQKLVPSFYYEDEFWRRTRECFEGLPEIAQYYQSQKSVKGPFTQSYTPVQI